MGRYTMRFAQIVFWVAGAWGIILLAPMYFLLKKINLQAPPAITHPEYYYAFLSVALVWQFAFLLIATDPVRFRPIMVPAIFEKFGYAATMVVLYLQMRLNRSQVIVAIPDLILGILFFVAYFKTPKHTHDL